jgi:hypothetical protein
MAKKNRAAKGQQKANQGRRSFVKGVVIYVADKAAGGVIGAGIGGALSRYATTCSTMTVVSTATAVVVSTATGVAAFEGHPPEVVIKLNGPGGVRAAEHFGVTAVERETYSFPPFLMP